MEVANAEGSPSKTMSVVPPYHQGPLGILHIFTWAFGITIKKRYTWAGGGMNRPNTEDFEKTENTLYGTIMTDRCYYIVV